MVQNFEFKGGYGVYKLRPHVGRSKMTNWLHASPVVRESIDYSAFVKFKVKKHIESVHEGSYHTRAQSVNTVHP